MLEKILNIQHPNRLQEKFKQTSELVQAPAFAVSSKEKDNVSLLDNDSARSIADSSMQSNAFYSFDDLTAVSEVPNAIEAVIHETQTVVNGSTIEPAWSVIFILMERLYPKIIFCSVQHPSPVNGSVLK